ncbi:MAG: hypothetical protein KGJ86_03735 [Chloroflexota bacterium]|nr:hypothetical protein [Chloroflexota bacterium]
MSATVAAGRGTELDGAGGFGDGAAVAAGAIDRVGWGTAVGGATAGGTVVGGVELGGDTVAAAARDAAVGAAAGALEEGGGGELTAGAAAPPQAARVSAAMSAPALKGGLKALERLNVSSCLDE